MKTVNISIPSLLAVAFIILKLCGVIQWSWVWVLSPIWIPFALFLLFAVVALLTTVVAYVVVKKDMLP